MRALPVGVLPLAALVVVVQLATGSTLSWLCTCLAVMSVATDQETTAMPLIDLDLIREQLLAIGWVKEARVSRRLPDTIAIDIVEREPAAIWQNRGRLSLIDADGTLSIDQVRSAAVDARF